MRWSTPSWLLLLAATVAGCGVREVPRETLYPAEGKVLLNGQPLCMGIIELTPKTPGQGMTAMAVVDRNGNFALRTYSNTEPDGAAAGEYHVSVKTYNVIEGGVLAEGVTPAAVPARFAEADTSGVSAEIAAGENRLTIELTEE
jgi:hypothetical protein